MSTSTHRLFVGNLPPGCSAKDLEKEFNSYGKVLNVDLKTKNNLVDPSNPVHFAFITLDTNDFGVKNCISEFKTDEYRGRYLNVSVARESFLDRLKSEREEASKLKKPSIQDEKTEDSKSFKKISANIQGNKKPSSSEASDGSDASSSSFDGTSKVSEKIPTVPVLKKQRMSSSSESEYDSREKKTNGLLSDGITVKNARDSLQNGKIVIQSTSNEPLHVILNSKKLSALDGKAKMADEKRKESLNKMKNQYNDQKSAIQKALSSVNSIKSKRIRFDEDDVENNASAATVSSKKQKLDIFNTGEDADSEEEDNFAIKDQFQGKKGQKLLELQSSYLDRRFKIDSRFLDDEKAAGKDSNKETISSEVNGEEEDYDERKWQLGIIESVIGRKLESLPDDKHKKKMHRTMLRYDPTKDEHQKFLNNLEKIDKKVVRTEINRKERKDSEKSETGVSKEQFFKVSDDLTKTLKRRGDGFSLLSMFGRSEDNKNDSQNGEAVLIPNSKSDVKLGNPFKFDTSSESEAEDFEIPADVSKNLKKGEKITGKHSKKSSIWTENFFLIGGDQRLKEGSTFFHPIEKKVANGEEIDAAQPEDYDKTKSKLRLLINKKINKHRKNQNMFQRKRNNLKSTHK